MTQPWRDSVADLAGLLADYHGANLHAVAARGSVARGTAVIGVSDIDLVALLHEDLGAVPLDLAVDRDITVGAETVTLTQAEFSHGQRGPWLQFALGFSGCSIRRPDVVAGVPEPVLGNHAVAHLKAAPKWLDRWRDPFEQSGDPQIRRKICQWLAKRITRAMFEAIMVDLNAYSSNIYPCAKATTACFPEHAAALWQAADLAVAPTDDLARMLGMVEPLDLVLRQLHQRRRGAV
ncbi:hypothetical protein [Actibacterium sp. 188UL27-1]|uniref:hypothetical protein n=1 Tax=Actibacterium sp. 188UL27-1 TaxID=2786961 RepID=UPI001959B4E8|nr:hypothetical protein [Actibacterium sp. 188UL27-1]MBM7068190.1 hypothetical protein [Actibacterium sp. 188UL27-1]